MPKQTAIDQPHRYEIQIEGRLSPHWASLFAGLTCLESQSPDGKPLTSLTGTFADQAALHGTLQSLYNLGCVLVSVSRIY